MKRYFIEEAKCGVSEGGMACGPVGGAVNAAIKFSADGVTKWLSNSEVDGIPNFFLTDEDVFEKLCADELSQEFVDYMNEHFASEFDGLDLGEYEDVFNSLTENPENPAVPLVRYLVSLTRCSLEDEESLIKLATGKYIDEVEVPLSEEELEYQEELAAEEDE